MPNPNWSKKSNARTRTKALADGRVKAQGVHEYCEKCPLVEICDNVQYNARNSSVWCVDNPRERREVMDKSKLFIKPIKPSKKELEFIEFREICTKQIEKAFGYIAPPIKVGLNCGHKKRRRNNG